MKQKLNILKIGGKILDNEEQLSIALKKFASQEGLKILVHGGGKKANQVCEQMGISPKMIEGRRVTNAPTLEVVTMVYAGLLNKKLVSQLQAFNCSAIGLTGADGNVIKAHKRIVKEIDYGFAGDIDSVDVKLIVNLIKDGFVPVFCSITHDKKGQLLNTNADTIATELARALSSDFSVSLKFHFEKRGVLVNPDDENTALSQLNQKEYQSYKKEGVISNGMIPKLDNAFRAKKSGAKEVFISNTEVIL